MNPPPGGFFRAKPHKQNAAVFPYLLYDAVNDSRTRPAHRLMDGIIKPIHDPFWATRYPPNGYRCRCTTVALTERQAAARGGVTQLVPPEAVPDAGCDYHGGEEAGAGIDKALAQAQTTGNPQLNQALQEKLENAKAITTEGTTPPMSQPGSTKPPPWTPAATAEEAEDVARKLGVQVVNYRGETFIGNVTNEAMSEVAARGLPLPEIVRVEATSFLRYPDAEKRVAEYRWQDAELVVNSGSVFWAEEERFPGMIAGEQFRKGWWSSASRLHPIRHELGHRMNHSASPKQWFQYLTKANMPAEALKEIVGQVSRRAELDPSEFVAEVFSGVLAGKTYRDTVMAWYLTFGGVNP